MLVICSLLVALTLNQTSPAADQPGRISGRVTLEGANTPVAGARVMLLPTVRPNGPMRPIGPVGPMGPPPQATTDQDGRYAFDRVAPGTYRVDVQKTGLAPLTDPPRSPTVQVAPGQSVDGVDRHLQKGAVITGRILDPNGEPLPDAQIMVMRRMTPPAASAMPARLMPTGGGQSTNDLGEFRVSGLAPGEYYVAAMLRPAMFGGGAGGGARATQASRTTLARTFYPGTMDQAAAQPLSVAAGAEVGNIVFTMQSAPAFRVSGIVVDENGNPVAGAMVMLMGDPMTGGFMGPGVNARSQDNGRFEINDVPPGTYRANATVMITSSNSGGGGGFVSSSFSTGGAAIRPAEVVVTDADVRGLRVVTRRPAPQ